MTEESAIERMPLTIRRVTAGDARLLFDWRNDPETRMQSGTTEAFEWGEHVAWLEKSLKNSRRILCIAENDAGTPIGTVRADLREDGFTEISYTIAPNWRGKGLSKPTVLSFVKTFLQGKKLAAKIKKGHAPSESVARALSLSPYAETPSDNPDDPRPLVEWR